MLRSWKGGVISVRGHLRVQVRDNHGKWRQHAVGMRDTPENRTKAAAKIGEWRAHYEALPFVDPRETARKLAEEKKRLGDQARATARARFKARSGESLACEACGWVPRPPLGVRAINVHHITPTTAGGSDQPENLIPLCPNCHALAHAIFGRSAAPGRAELVAAIRAAAA
jgi:5-methylcytosine-specific restriction endonuclease McrA